MNSNDVRIHPEVVSRTLEGEEVLLQLETGAYFGLNEVGTLIWKFLKTGLSRAEIIERLENEFDVPAVEATKDFEDFIAELKRKALAV